MKRNFLARLLALAGLAGLATGCSGINASKSFSPLSFFLPGLVRAEPAKTTPEPVAPAPVEPVADLAQIQ